MVPLLFLAAGAQDQGAAGGEGADGRALSAQHGAGEEGHGIQAGGGGQSGDQGEQGGANHAGGGAEEAHDGAYQAEGHGDQDDGHVGADPGAEHFNGTGLYGDGNEHTGTGNHQDGVPGHPGNDLLLGSQLQQQRDDGEDNGHQAHIDLTGQGRDGLAAGDQELQHGEDQHHGHHHQDQDQGLLLLLVVGFGLLKLHALADVPVGLEAEAEQGDDDQRGHNGQAAHGQRGGEGIHGGKLRGALIGGIHQSPENNAQGRSGEVASGQSAAVDGHSAGELIHPGLLADEQGDGSQEGQHGEVGSAHDGQDHGYEEEGIGQQARELPAGIQQAPGDLFQGAVGGGYVVEQAHRQNDEHGVCGPVADEGLGLQAHDEAADDVGEDDAEESGVDLGLIAQEHGQGNGGDDTDAEDRTFHFSLSFYASMPRR